MRGESPDERPRCHREVTNAAILCQRTPYRNPAARPAVPDRSRREHPLRAESRGLETHTAKLRRRSRNNIHRLFRRSRSDVQGLAILSMSEFSVHLNGFEPCCLRPDVPGGADLPFLPMAGDRPYTRRRSRGGKDPVTSRGTVAVRSLPKRSGAEQLLHMLWIGMWKAGPVGETRGVGHRGRTAFVHN